MWHFLHYLPKVTDGSCIFDKREKKNWMDVDDLTPVITSYRVCFKTERGGPNWTGVTKDSMLFQKSITIRYWDYNQAKLFWPEWMMYFQHTPSPSVDSLRVGWDKVVWNYPIPYLISYPCAIFSGTWVWRQSVENQQWVWIGRKDCSQ